ncbi:MAG: RDD family protein [Fimbriimonadales bacterium]|nr:RDD family protein [Fimbriimonadales bacterium]
MPYEFVLQSPEKVEIRYEIAGLGSRALAAVLDDLLVLTIIGVVGALLALLEETTQAISSLYSLIGEGWLIAGLIFFAYILWFAYYIVFEIFWNGQTPAKRAFGLRVIMLEGTPVTPTAVLIRELVRLVDAFPLCMIAYNVAGLLAFFSPYGQRLGDMLAGTFVIKEQRTPPPTLETLTEVSAQPHPLESYLPSLLPISPTEYRALRAFLDRREQLSPDARERLAWELYQRLREPLGMPEQPPAATEGILEAIATRYARERGRLE